MYSTFILIGTFLISINGAQAQSLTCPEAVERLSRQIKTAPQSPEAAALMDQVKDCVGRAASGQAIPVRDFTLPVSDVYLTKVENNTLDVQIVISGMMNRCAKVDHHTLTRDSQNLYILSV